MTNLTRSIVTKVLMALLIIAGTASIAWAQNEAPAESTGWQKPIPVSFSLDYTLVSDYIYRGGNLSEYVGEGRERGNQQLTLGAEVDLGKFGAVGISTWFEWFAGQQVTAFGDPDAKNDLQEVDYTIYWGYDIPGTPVSIETGWIAYTYPHVGGDLNYTNEWYISVGVDDSQLFGTENPVLNPYIAYYLDTDDVDGCWIEMGISHDFALAEMGMAGAPVLSNLTVTPSAVLGIDKDQFDTGSHVHNLLYGLAVSYDLSAALGIPEQYGSFTLTGFVNFSDAINEDVINDEFFGGISLGWEW